MIRKTEKRQDKQCSRIPGVFVLLLIAVLFIAHIYNLAFLIVNKSIMNNLFIVSLSVIILGLVLFILIYERRKFAVKLCIYLFSYIIIIAISFFMLGRLTVLGLIADLVISAIVIAFCLKSKFVKTNFKR
jgi:hypothetical protein